MAYTNMHKILLLSSSFIACVTIIMQLGMDIIVFSNDYNCRTLFDSASTSVGNKMQCMASLNTIQTQCKCEYFGNNYDDNGNLINFWMRVFDDGTLAMASIIFIILMLVEIVRSYFMILRICDVKVNGLTTFEYCSVFGFFALVLNPSSFYDNIPGTHIESIMIIVDILSIGLIFQYCNAFETSIENISDHRIFILIALIMSICNGLRNILNLYCVNRQNHPLPNKSNKKMTKHHIIDPTIIIPTAESTFEPPAYDDKV
jgi:hypothetical protein